MKVLVTGATGFVGSEIVAELSKNNFEVYSLGSSKFKNTNKLPNFMEADIADFESLKTLLVLKNIDVVIHSAGLAHQFDKVKEEDFWKINVEGTKNIARISFKLKAKHFMLVSSVSVYGKNKYNLDKNLIDENCLCNPEGVYARSKFEAEKAAIDICVGNQIPLTILRLATVIGENDRGNTARLIKAIDKRRFLWIGNGKNYKSLIYKNDVAKACLKILEKKTNKTEIFNVSAEPVLMKEVVSEIAAELKKNVPQIYVPEALLNKIFQINAKVFSLKRVFKLSETVKKWLSEDVFSSEKIAAAYGFRAETTISEAIRRQVKAYQNQK